MIMIVSMVHVGRRVLQARFCDNRVEVCIRGQMLKRTHSLEYGAGESEITKQR